ncbi:lipoprotein-releasing ABC transporter permease subunit [Achromobacter insuavis]
MLKIPYELWIGARYAGLARIRQRRGRRDRFISFIAASSMAGIALGVAALIVVLSVMNGFQKEVRDRMLSVLPHIDVLGRRARAGARTVAAVRRRRQAQPRGQGRRAVRGGAGHAGAGPGPARRAGARHRPGHRGQLQLPRQMVAGKLTDLKPGGFGVVLGNELADGMGVKVGDTLLMLAPQGSISPAGFAPRMRQFTVVGVFSSGHYEYDSSLAFVDNDDAAKVFRDSGTAGVRLRVADMQKAPEVAAELRNVLPPYVMASDWSRNNRTWFAAVQTEKRMMFLILALIVAVAAFNLLSSLVMAVKDKQSDIAILRTLGAGPGEVARIFLVQGALIGVIGTLLGVAGGILIAYNVDVIVPFIERLLGVHFLPREIYFISALPSDPQVGDIVTIGVTSLVLSLLATLYPSWRASRLQPTGAAP